MSAPDLEERARQSRTNEWSPGPDIIVPPLDGAMPDLGTISSGYVPRDRRPKPSPGEEQVMIRFMSLRDQFACAALSGLRGYENRERAAKHAYELADAMLKAREEKS